MRVVPPRASGRVWLNALAFAQNIRDGAADRGTGAARRPDNDLSAGRLDSFANVEQADAAFPVAGVKAYPAVADVKGEPDAVLEQAHFDLRARAGVLHRVLDRLATGEVGCELRAHRVCCSQLILDAQLDRRCGKARAKCAGEAQFADQGRLWR